MSSNYLVRPKGDGLRAALFDLEADIMEVVWSQEWAEFDVSQVLESLQRNREIAYTTVMTTVARLAEKGLLKRHKEGRKYLYSPSQTREQFLAALARDVFARLTSPSRDAATAFLVDRVSELDSDELDRLEDLIKRRREEIE